MTPRLFIKLSRDLLTIWDRILLMILALSLTLIMFSAVLYIWSVSTREMRRDYLSGSPASATLLLEKGLDANQTSDIVAKARQQPGVIDATLRTQFTLLVQEKPDTSNPNSSLLQHAPPPKSISQQENITWGSIPLQFFVVAPDDPMRIETFQVDQGGWPPAPGEILIERSALELMNRKVGDTIIVQAPNGTPTPLRISGVVHTPGLTPAFQEQTGHAFISTASLPLLGQPLTLDALKIQVADQPGLTTPSRNRDVIVPAARNFAGWLRQTYDVTVEEIQAPTPYAHPHQGQMDSLMMGLFFFGAAGLVLSAILVATMLNGLLTQQIPQIGIMKAIGARTSRVLQMYLLMILVIAVASTAIASVPGIIVSRTFIPIMLTMLGVRAENLMAPWWTYAVIVASGIGVPLLFALGSLLKASRMTVREALDYRGIDRRRDTSTRFDAGLSRLPGLNRTILMAFRNNFRRRTRFLLSVGLLAFAGAVFVAGMSVMDRFQTFLDREKALRRWDVEVQLVRGSASDNMLAADLTNLVAKIPNVTRVEGWSIVQTSVVLPGQQISVTRTYPDQGHGSVAVTVVPPDNALVTAPATSEGRWLRPGETGAIVISMAGLTEDLADVHSGDTIQLTLNSHLTRWLVVGIAEPVGGRGGIFITEAGYEAATDVTLPALLRVVTDKHDEETRTAVAQAANRALTNAGIAVRSATSVGRAEAVSAGHMLPLILVFLGLAVAISVVGFAGLTSTMSTNVLERTREFGVMSAIGATASTIRSLVVLEGIFIAVMSCVGMAILAPLFTALMMGNLSLPVNTSFQISVLGVVIWMIVVVLGAVVATLAPASLASRLTVREALAYL
jgi:putative ABC transport system permease protein